MSVLLSNMKFRKGRELEHGGKLENTTKVQAWKRPEEKLKGCTGK